MCGADVLMGGGSRSVQSVDFTRYMEKRKICKFFDPTGPLAEPLEVVMRKLFSR